MLIAVGLVVLAAALVIGISGVLDNRGPSHALTHPFTVLGHHINGSSGRLFLFGAIVGAIALAGLLMFLSGLRRTAQRRRQTRRELKEARRTNEAIARDRDQLAAAQHRHAAAAAEPGRGEVAPLDANRAAGPDATRAPGSFEPMPPPREDASHRAP